MNTSKKFKMLMQKSLTVLFTSLIVLTMLTFQNAKSQVNVTGANSGNGSYSTLTSAFTAINSGSQNAANIAIQITGNTTEPGGGAILNSGAWTAMYIFPTGNRTISGAANPGVPLIDFNGADNVTIDGLWFGGNFLTISNTTVSSTAGTSTIRFHNDARNNTVSSCTVLGSSTTNISTDGGTVWFGADAVVTGNDLNTISFCDIGPAGSNLPTKAIYSSGTTSSTTLFNSGNKIQSCNIYDYFNPSGHSAGIYIKQGSTDYIFSDSKYYQSSARTLTTANWHSAIWIDFGNNHLINGNTIGYAAKNLAGIYTFTGNAGGSRFIPIFLAVGNTTATSVQGNTITSLAISGSMSGVDQLCPFAGIFVYSGETQIGNITGNTIGSMSIATSITYTSSSASISNIYGITNIGGINNWTTSNNNIGGIMISNSGGSSSNLLCMNSSTTGAWTCQNNTIGGTVTHSINNTSTATTSFVNGIVNLTSASVISNNIIRNITNSGGSGASQSGSILGIVSVALSNQTISGNQIHRLTNLNTTLATVVSGIYYLGGNGTNLVEKNKIFFLNISSTTGIINGINIQNGTTNFQNNMISLGTTVSGTAVNKASLVRGIVEAAGTNNFYFNSIYIGGYADQGSSANSYCFNSGVQNNTRNYKNNIFHNARFNNGPAGKNYVIAIPGTVPNPPGLASNYNDFYPASGNLAFYNSTDITTIAQWRTATGQDVRSFSDDPQFINPAGTSGDVDLHISNNLTFIEGAGVNIPSVTQDFDGQLRSDLTPVDMGADAGNFVNYIYTVVVGGSNLADGNYTSLNTAFDQINSNSQTAANIEITINGNITIPAPGAILNSGTWNSLIVKPGGGGSRTISNSGSLTYLITLNGAQKVTIDGLNSGGNSLIITNDNIGSFSGVSTIFFNNDASNNKITRCTIRGASRRLLNESGGTIWFNDAGALNGNDNNVISNCDITSSAAVPTKAIYFSGIGPVSKNNSGDTIRDCNIYNFGSATGAGSAGIYITTGTMDVAILNNKFYQPSSNNMYQVHSAISINNTSGNNFTISGNTIGYQSNTGTGIYSINSQDYFARIAMIDLNVGTVSPSTISGNTIAGIGVTGFMGGLDSTASLSLINVYNGTVHISNNVIGSMTVNSSIIFNPSGPYTNDVFGISHRNTGTMIVQNNTIGGITCNAATSAWINFCGIRNLSPESWVCTNNTVGGSILNSIESNTERANVCGIANYNGSSLITGNTIRNLTSRGGSPIGAASPMIGILNTSQLDQIISDNKIQTIAANNPNTEIKSAIGIYFSGGAGTNIVAKNYINSVYGLNSNTSVYGIYVNSGTGNYQNNMISLGTGNGSIYGCNVYGIAELGGTNNFYFNSIFLGGNPVNDSKNTYSFYSNVNSASRNYRNNILYNARSNSGSSGKHYSISIAGTSGLNSNYNDLYSTGSGGVLGFFTSDRNNLATWKSATGLDSSSISANPLFTGATDLHIDSTVFSPVSNAGIPVAGITNDYDGNTRHASNPDMGADEFNGVGGSITLNLTAFIEGFYNPGSNSQVSDTIDVTLRNSSSPFAIADSFTGVVPSNGTASIQFITAPSGNYYIVVKHRNTIETWSTNPVSLLQGSSTNFDLSASASQAFGNNIKQVDTSPVRFAIFSGDVDQDDVVDLSDIINVFNDANNFLSGYVVTDVTGDEFVDLSDITLTFNNANAFVSVVKP